MGLVSRLGFRGRLIAAMISLVALVSLVIIALLMVYLFEDEKSRALEQLAIGERLLEGHVWQVFPTRRMWAILFRLMPRRRCRG